MSATDDTYFDVTAATPFPHELHFQTAGWRRWDPLAQAWEFIADGPMEGDERWERVFVVAVRS